MINRSLSGNFTEKRAAELKRIKIVFQDPANRKTSILFVDRQAAMRFPKVECLLFLTRHVRNYKRA